MPRVALPVIQEKPAGRVHCLQCAKCCTYVAIGMNAPTTPKLASEILWHLYHQGVSVCRDEAGEWYVQFEARCRNLGPGNLCAIYENRPHICRAYDDAVCEVNAPQAGLLEFREPAQYLAYLREKKPKLYKAIEGKYIPPALLAAAPQPAVVAAVPVKKAPAKSKAKPKAKAPAKKAPTRVR